MSVQLPISRGEVILIRHGETAWSRSGQHTGLTDMALTEQGSEAAKALTPLLAGFDFSLVLSSPLQRATVTCQLAGLGDSMHLEPDLVEWNYGDYEGMTSAEIERLSPGWLVFNDGCPGGESPEAVGERVDRVVDTVRSQEGQVALFAHGHVLRVFIARWLGLAPKAGAHFLLDTSTLNILSYYKGVPAVKCWNAAVN